MTIREEAFGGKPVSAFIVDAHTHIGSCYARGWYQSPKETLNSAVIARMNRLGVDCIITAPHMLGAGMMSAANISAANAADEHPGRIYGYISICPNEGLNAVKAELKRYQYDTRFVGLKLLPGYHGSLLQKEYQYAADFADEMACIVLIHTWSGDPPIYEIEKMLEKRNRIKILCAHQGGGYDYLTKELAEAMKRQPNLYMEICGSLNNVLSMEDIVQLVGEDRIVYGSDSINLDMRYDFGRVVFSTLADDVKKKLLSGNLLELLKSSKMGRIEI
jgi:predicted TIM-barrel fold metal-dependent hydrolase